MVVNVNKVTKYPLKIIQLSTGEILPCKVFIKYKEQKTSKKLI